MALIFVLGIVTGLALFFLLHLRPLREDEVLALAGRRRTKTINSYYAFDKREYVVNAEFKKRMPAEGGFTITSEPLGEFPAVAAGLLKYKKHEWIILAFERNQSVELAWINKGPDCSQVHCGISMLIIRTASVNDSCSSVLVFHNHPNPDPSTYSLKHASDQDMLSAGELSSQLKALGVNLLEFVCERGIHYEYWRSVCDSFLPIGSFTEEIVHINGRSRGQNFSLHWERLFG
ncbi:MAG: hypothetical protein ACLQVA_07950 [Candidatus Brocadiia bacterium]